SKDLDAIADSIIIGIIVAEAGILAEQALRAGYMKARTSIAGALAALEDGHMTIAPDTGEPNRAIAAGAHVIALEGRAIDTLHSRARIAAEFATLEHRDMSTAGTRGVDVATIAAVVIADAILQHG